MHKVKKSVGKGKIVDPKDFIVELQGFLKRGSRLPISDPLKLKEIWQGLHED